MKKRMITAITVMLLLTLLSAAAVHASAAIRSVEYEGRGKVDVDFSSKVNYKKVKVSVRDAKGKKISADIVDRDSDDLEFVLQSYKPGSRYTFTISGIRRRGEKAFGNVKGSIRIPKSKGAVPVRETDYDSEDREVEFAFSSGVEWKNPTVTITDGKKQYVLKIREKKAREIEVKVRKLKKGKTYHYTITGIRRTGTSAWSSVSGSFAA